MYESVFAPTGRIESVRVLLAIASVYRLQTAKFDITTFFLTGDIDMVLSKSAKTRKIEKILKACISFWVIARF